MFAAVRRVALLLSAVVLFATSVGADPIVVTSGDTFFYWDSGPTSATLRGNGLAVNAEGLGYSTTDVVLAGSLSFIGSFYFNNLASDVLDVTVNGTHYEAFLDGSMAMDGPSFVVPPPSGSGPVTFSTPFTMAGRLRGTSSAGSVLFDVDLAGAGTASATLFGRPGTNLYSTAGVKYVFEGPDLSPTPEPATLLLMGTGVAGVVARARRRGARPTAAG